MWKQIIISLLCTYSAFCGETAEVLLPTRSYVKPLYISRIHVDPAEWDWRYFDELREVLAFDFQFGGCVSIAPVRQELEDAFDWSDVKKGFLLEQWKKAQLSFVFAVAVHQKQLSLTAFDLSRETAKKYPSVPLSGNIQSDRRLLHKLADRVHKDLFGVEGISSLQILYTQRTKNEETGGLGWLSEVWVCDSDGANAQQLTFHKGYCLSPGFFPAAGGDKEFFYVFNNEGQSKIYRASLAQPSGDLFISLRGNQMLPSLSKTGNLMAFITDVAGRPDLFVQYLDERKNKIGKPRQLYSAPRATQASPTFSPDGKQVAFVSDKDGPPRIYVLDIPSIKETHKPKPRLLTTKNRENTAPAWSPDGKKLAYAAKTDGVRQIWVYDFETGVEWQLTTGSEVKENPAWAPDSLHLLYNTESDTSCELYVVHIVQREPILISKGAGQKRFGCWETR